MICIVRSSDLLAHARMRGTYAIRTFIPVQLASFSGQLLHGPKERKGGGEKGLIVMEPCGAGGGGPFPSNNMGWWVATPLPFPPCMRAANGLGGEGG